MCPPKSTPQVSCTANRNNKTSPRETTATGKAEENFAFLRLIIPEGKRRHLPEHRGDGVNGTLKH